jgi:DNA polymerase-4
MAGNPARYHLPMGRTIIHADVDAFYASVEQLDNPELIGKPVVVGGPPEGRGVVAAASYEARRFGVHSAMPMSRALRLCPAAVRISPRFERYAEVSRRIMAVFRSVTPLVEPLSMDEAFLDITGRHAEYDGARGLAERIKREIKATTGLTVSIGIGTNKTVAKIASDKEKPDGLVVVPPGSEAAFLAPLPVRALWGVGPKSEKALVEAGFRTVGQIAASDPAQFEALFGQRGRELWEMANGRDDREIVTEWERKSVGAENTFPRDLPDGPELREETRRIAKHVAERLQRSGAKARCIAIKLRYRNFRTITRQLTRAEPTDDALEIAEAAGQLLDKVTQEHDMFRLLGIHASKLSGVGGEPGQLPMFEAPAT